MGISTARSGVKRRLINPLTDSRPLREVMRGFSVRGAGLIGHALGSALGFLAVMTTASAQPATKEPLGRIEVVARGPYGEITTAAEREILASDLGRELKVGGVLFDLESIRNPDTRKSALVVTIRAPGHAPSGISRQKGTHRYLVNENRKLVTLFGQSPGPLSDVRVHFGARSLPPSHSPITPPSTDLRRQNPSL